jgi:hypothetical protein
MASRARTLGAAFLQAQAVGTGMKVVAENFSVECVPWFSQMTCRCVLLGTALEIGSTTVQPKCGELQRRASFAEEHTAIV